MSSEAVRCRYCGATLSLARIVQLDEAGAFEHACESCAVEMEAGDAAEPHAS